MFVVTLTLTLGGCHDVVINRDGYVPEMIVIVK